MRLIAEFRIYNLKLFFPGIIPPDSCRNAPGAWTQTPISAWLASVPIVPVSRNDRCATGLVKFDILYCRSNSKTVLCCVICLVTLNNGQWNPAAVAPGLSEFNIDRHKATATTVIVNEPDGTEQVLAQNKQRKSRLNWKLANTVEEWMKSASCKAESHIDADSEVTAKTTSLI